MTFKEMTMKCMAQYVSLWGDDWIKQRHKSIGVEYSDDREKDMIYFAFSQSDKLLEPPPAKPVIRLGNTPPQHYTEFKCNMKTGEVELVEHY